MKAVTIAKIGMNKKAPRVWLEGQNLKRAGFEGGRQYDVVFDASGRTVRLQLSENGARLVCRRERKNREIPIIDLNSVQLLDVFAGMDSVRVIFGQDSIQILPLAGEERRLAREAALKEAISTGVIPCASISHGAGILDHALHTGMEAAGLKPKLVWANDIEPDLLEHAQHNNNIWNADTVALAMPMQELAFDEAILSQLPPALILAAGLPCNGASVSGRSRNGIDCAEAHEKFGYLSAAFLAIVGRLNPAILLVENVVPYKSSASMWILRHQLRDMGYTVHETTLSAQDWNVLEKRSRMCMVAVSRGLSFDFAGLQKPEKYELRLGDVLENIALDAPCWSEMSGLVTKQSKDVSLNRGFLMQVCDADSTSVPVIGAGYAKVRSTEIKVRHPENQKLMRQVTLQEHLRCKKIPAALLGDETGVTFGHKLLGQSVCYPPFVAVGRLLGECLRGVGQEPIAPVVQANAAQFDLFAL